MVYVPSYLALPYYARNLAMVRESHSKGGTSLYCILHTVHLRAMARALCQRRFVGMVLLEPLFRHALLLLWLHRIFDVGSLYQGTYDQLDNIQVYENRTAMLRHRRALHSMVILD